MIIGFLIVSLARLGKKLPKSGALIHCAKATRAIDSQKIELQPHFWDIRLSWYHVIAYGDRTRDLQIASGRHMATLVKGEIWVGLFRRPEWDRSRGNF